MNRREAVIGLLVGAVAAACNTLGVEGGRRRRLLVFTKSSGYEHSVVKRAQGGGPSLVERTLTALGAREGFDVVCEKDGSIFTPQRLGEFDAFCFFTSGLLTERGTDGQPPMSPEGKEALLEAVWGGKGFVAFHAASDSFHTQPDPPDRSNRYRNHGAASDPYVRMLGGEFIAHGTPQKAPMRVVDPEFPGMAAFGGGVVQRFGEWYSLKDFAPDLHVIAVLDTAGMEGTMYRRPPYPVVWARRHGQGRVFYSALGHFEEEWEDPAFLSMALGAIRWAFGDVEADTTPNLEAVAPGYAQLPPPPGSSS
jgi:type 1 glutamine amidotransferase